VGNLSRQLHYTFNANQQEPGPGAPAPRRPLFALAPGVVAVTQAITDGIANYHAFQASVEKRFSASLGFVTSYTWAHAIDHIPLDFGGGDPGPSPQDIRYRHAAERSNSVQDQRHRLVHSMNYVLPVGKGKRWDMGSGLANGVLGDWQTNVIFTAQTGLPFTPVLASPVANAGASRPDRRGKGVSANPDPAGWFDTSFNTAGAAWATPAQFTYGNAGRNILFGPGRINFDFSLFKAFPITERWNLQFRAELFNLFNTPQFSQPNASIGNPNAGIINATAGTPRQVQFALRLQF
jgi:hypothetical protein